MPVSEDYLKQLPTKPGVYLMLDKNGKVIYVGKAGNLRNRVRSYFVSGGDERPTVHYLMQRVDSISTMLTETEKEALILENNLIKQHKPKYNVDLRDDKSFFSLRLDISHSYPRLTLVRTQKIKPDHERYFGPYSSAGDAKLTLKSILKLFPLRQCADRQLATCTRPCLNCQMKRCLCPCTGKVPKEEYAGMVHSVTLLLQGRSDDLTANLQEQMNEAARNLDFEGAARLRDTLTAVNRTLEAQNVSFFHLKDQDVLAVIRNEENLHIVQVLSFRKGRLISGESFAVVNPALEPSEVLEESILRYYVSGSFVPKELLISLPIEHHNLVEERLSELRGNKVTVRVPLAGLGLKLLQLALKNAHDAMLREKTKQGMEEILQGIARRLRLKSLPRVIEGYDISNISGSNSYGAKVSFKDGVPYKNGYRKFKIRDFSDQDDPGMIYQTVQRRCGHVDEDPLPDLFLIDGGKSQLNAAHKALAEILGDDSAPSVVSIAKIREEGDEERFYIPNQKNEVLFPKGDSGLHLLMRVRDEAHRFVHKSSSRDRTKEFLLSALDDIPGIGPKKRNALLTAFQGMKALRGASDEEIAAVPGINRKDVERIRAYFDQPPPGPSGLFRPSNET